MKIDFSAIFFTGELLDRWGKGWVASGGNHPHRLRHRKDRGGVRFGGEIIGDEWIGPWRVSEGIMMKSQIYIDYFLECTHGTLVQEDAKHFEKDFYMWQWKYWMPD